MRAPLPLWMLTAALGPLLGGCGSDCDETDRLDGEWAMDSRVSDDTWQVSGFDVDNTDETTAAEASLDQAALLGQLFVNGTSTWTLARSGESDRYALTIDGQEYDATLTPQKGACNALDLRFQGAWSGAEGSSHSFTYVGQLTFLGDEITGEWKYTDNFTWEDRAASGTVAIPQGVFSGTLGGRDSGS